MATTQEPGGGTTTVPLRKRQRNALRADIQHVALRMFAEHGFDKVTTEAIAESIVDYCRQPRFESHAISAYLESVRVRDPNKFIA